MSPSAPSATPPIGRAPRPRKGGFGASYFRACRMLTSYLSVPLKRIALSPGLKAAPSSPAAPSAPASVRGASSVSIGFDSSVSISSSPGRSRLQPWVPASLTERRVGFFFGGIVQFEGGVQDAKSQRSGAGGASANAPRLPALERTSRRAAYNRRPTLCVV